MSISLCARLCEFENGNKARLAISKYGSPGIQNNRCFRTVSKLANAESPYTCVVVIRGTPFCGTNAAKIMIKYEVTSLLNELSNKGIDIRSLNRETIKHYFNSM